MGLQEEVDERVSFLREQINPKNEATENSTFQIQIDTLRSADIEKVAFLILQKKAQLKNCKDVAEADKLFTELDALEWLQRQVVKHI